MAWLYAAPKALNEGALAGSDKRTRIQRLEEGGNSPDVPPLPFGTYLLGALFEAGPVSYAAMGEIALTHEAIGWYQLNNGIQLSPWEISVLRRLSSVWITEGKAAERPECPPPYVGPFEAERRERLPGFIKSFLRD